LHSSAFIFLTLYKQLFSFLPVLKTQFFQIKFPVKIQVFQPEIAINNSISGCFLDSILFPVDNNYILQDEFDKLYQDHWAYEFFS